MPAARDTHGCPTAADARRFRRRLLAWYDAHHRRLPWRVSPDADGVKPDPYHVLVSETMLQQTQVATVEPYFRRFVERWPTVEDLAAAEEQQVLRLWQGLGYYRRAKHLLAAARVIVAEHGGRVPDTAGVLHALPGVGRYTAGAVASIAFGRSEPVLDGNVARVLTRWFAVEEPADAPAVRDRLWSLARRLVPTPRGRPGDFNQALMELGALVCRPKQPQCDRCPVAAHCLAHRLGMQHELPCRMPRRAPREVEHHTIAIERRGRVLMQQRPARGLWSGMWQLPTAESLPAPVGPQDVARWVIEQLGARVAMPHCSKRFTHQTTHRTIRFVLWRAASAGGRVHAGAGVWRRLDDVDDLPLPRPQQRLVQELLQSRRK